MEFRIADTFTGSLARLTGDEQKAVKTTAFDLQMNPSNPGMSFHKLDKARDKNFWSVRVNRDIRLIVHKTENSLLLCYVAHHDKAYEWAERRKLEVHPATGAAQLVEIREKVREIFVPVYIQEEKTQVVRQEKLFEDISNEELLSYGVPLEWLEDVKNANEENLFKLTDYLPAEAGEALLELATGGKPLMHFATGITDPFAHPDAQRRFRTMHNLEELERALSFPWDKWTIFLHPAQEELVERKYNGPARVAGSAGTGKTIVALHRAVFLAKTNADSRILLTTFSRMLANALKLKLRRLISNEPKLAEQIEIYSLDDIGVKFYKANIGKPDLASNEQIRAILKNASTLVEHKFSFSFLLTEWRQVVDMWQIKSWEEYKDVKRLGRKTRLPENQRSVLWAIFDQVNRKLSENKLLTLPALFENLTELYNQCRSFPFDYVVVDEAQDLTVYHLKFLAAAGNNNPGALFFAGDLGQRIFQQAFSWKSVGVDVRGRSKTLHVNYRTSHQIRQHADKLLGNEVTDVDGNVEDRSKTVSIFNGPNPDIKTFLNEKEEELYVGNWIKNELDSGVAPHELGVFVRSDHQVDRAVQALKKANVSYIILDETVDTISNKVAISTMHFAKGLEFKSVAVMACDDEIIPLQERIETVTDTSDLEEVYNTERQLLYVACTRARDCLLITSVEPKSEFLDDLAVI
jgi:mRNA-degrading endonuclease RelE of RelBE toxin-antitoxin system